MHCEWYAKIVEVGRRYILMDPFDPECDELGVSVYEGTIYSWIYCRRYGTDESAQCWTYEYFLSVAWGSLGNYKNAGRWGTAKAQNVEQSLVDRERKSSEPRSKKQKSITPPLKTNRWQS